MEPSAKQIPADPSMAAGTQRPVVRPVLVFFARLCVTGGVAAVGMFKLADLHDFADALRVSTGVSRTLAFALSASISITEIATLSAWFPSVGWCRARWMLLGLMLSALTYQIWLLLLKPGVICHCFGVLSRHIESQHHAPIAIGLVCAGLICVALGWK